MTPAKLQKNLHRNLFNGDEETGDENSNPTILEALRKKEAPAEPVSPVENRYGITRAVAEPPKPKPARASYPSGPKAVFRCIPISLKDDLDNLAGELNVPMGYLAYYLFELGLEDFNARRLSFDSQLTADGYTLYPEEHRRAGRPLRNAKAKRDKLVGFHGVPKEIVEDIENIAVQILVPQGEVARRLLEYGIQRHRTGKTRLTSLAVAEFVRRAKAAG